MEQPQAAAHAGEGAERKPNVPVAPGVELVEIARLKQYPFLKDCSDIVLKKLQPQFMERSFALDRAGYVNEKGRGNPLRLATARPHEAEFFVAGVPPAVQRALLMAVDRLAGLLGYNKPV